MDNFSGNIGNTLANTSQTKTKKPLVPFYIKISILPFSLFLLSSVVCDVNETLYHVIYTNIILLVKDSKLKSKRYMHYIIKFVHGNYDKTFFRTAELLYEQDNIDL